MSLLQHRAKTASSTTYQTYSLSLAVNLGFLNCHTIIYTSTSPSSPPVYRFDVTSIAERPSNLQSVHNLSSAAICCLRHDRAMRQHDKERSYQASFMFVDHTAVLMRKSQGKSQQSNPIYDGRSFSRDLTVLKSESTRQALRSILGVY